MSPFLQVISQDGHVWQLALEGAGGQISSIRAELKPDGNIRIYIAVFSSEPVTRTHARNTLYEVAGFAASKGVRGIVLISENRLVRHEARLAGFEGPLRGELSAPSGRIARTHSASIFEGCADRAARSDRLSVIVKSLGPEAAPYVGNRLTARLIRRPSGPSAGTIELAISGEDNNAFRLSVPDTHDLMPEPIAMAADTAGRVLRRFRQYSGTVRMIRFDRSYSGMTTGRIGGVADSGDGVAHLSSLYVQADRDPRQLSQAPKPNAPAWSSPPLINAFSLPSVTDLDVVVAHELWHLIWRDFEARRYRDALKIDMELGSAIGAATLGKAIERKGRQAEPINRAAFGQLRAQISEYATTNLVEAHAEIFGAWWRGPGSDAPLIKRFGEMVSKYFPQSD